MGTNDISISINQMMEFCTADPMSKATVIERLVAQSGLPYNPATDYWKQFRDGLRKLHGRDLPPEHLVDLIPRHSDKKAANYQQMTNAYTKWRGSVAFSGATAPPRRRWSQEDASFLLNPELAVNLDGVPHVVKLYQRAANG